MRLIYLVRHGESEGNIGPIRQDSSSPLTDKGRVQASAVAERCNKLDFDTVVCSTSIRTRQTAEIILRSNSKPIDFSDLFVERRRSSEVVGKPKDTPLAIEVEKLVRKNFYVPGWRYSDEENFEDLKDRALKALNHLAELPQENILVITHSVFLKVMAACVMFGKSLKVEECHLFMRKLRTENTGLTVFEFDKDAEDQWKIGVWNDYAHLG